MDETCGATVRARKARVQDLVDAASGFLEGQVRGRGRACGYHAVVLEDTT